MLGIEGWFLDVITTLYEAIGWPGVVFLMGVESAAIPFPSELIMPLAGWLHGPLKEDVSFRLRALGEMAGEWIDVDYLEHRISTDSYDSYRIFNLLVLESWWRQWPQTLKI